MRSKWRTDKTESATTVRMTGSRNASNVQAAMQYLIWALEDIEKTGNHKAAKHARIALEALRQPPRIS
jgi:hypothetical protein